MRRRLIAYWKAHMRNGTEPETFVVVADGFANFAENTSVITLGALSRGSPPIRSVPRGRPRHNPGWASAPMIGIGSRIEDRETGQAVTAPALPGRRLPGTEVLKLDEGNVLWPTCGVPDH